MLEIERERWGASDNALYKVLEKEMKIKVYGDRDIERERDGARVRVRNENKRIWR